MTSLVLNDDEKQVFSLLLDVVKNKTPDTILRLAGGIVRDRLLCIDSNDIDIAVSNMSGLEFASLVVGYLKENNLSYKLPTVIKANPDQSKHLETAMLEINGLSIDFVNLRKETYADSRIPTIEIGTIEEDARRRDLSINALYYNLHTEEIEDYVGGLEDLTNCIARTPIDPIQTFIDDPLRIYRCIRFATKYTLEVQSEIIWAARSFKVVEALQTKVSAERVGKELFGYLLSDGSWKNGCFSMDHYSSAGALELLEKMDLLHIVFPTCIVNFHKAYYELINIKASGLPQDILTSTLAIIFYNNISSDIADTLLLNKCPKNIINRVVLLIKSTKFLKYSYDKDKELRRFLSEVKNDWEFAVSIAEVQMIGDPEFENGIWDRLNKLIDEQGGIKALSPIKGADLIEEGFNPGKNIGLALAAVDEELLSNPKLTYDEAFEICLPFKDQPN